MEKDERVTEKGRRIILMSKDEDVAEALHQVARSLVLLGNADAVGPEGQRWGAIEAHGLAIKDAAEKIAEALQEVASAIRESNQRK